jgi:hypothetical protein
VDDHPRFFERKRDNLIISAPESIYRDHVGCYFVRFHQRQKIREWLILSSPRLRIMLSSPRLRIMKIYTAVVASITDYRKNQELRIECVSSHTTEREAKKVALFHICNAMEPGGLLNIDRFDEFFDLSTILGEEVTPFRKDRLVQWIRDREIEYVQDDVPEDEFKAFIKIEEPIVENLADIFTTKHEQGSICFSQEFEDSTADFKIPDLPNGEYVWEPITYRIEEQELDLGEDEDNERKRKAA